MPEPSEKSHIEAPYPLRRPTYWIAAIVLLSVILRLVALSSDAYPRLSWSSGLLTDEGYYLHNARNFVLFHEARQDDWNNQLIMPTLHYLQVGVFEVFGVGIVQARMISVVFSLLLMACAVLATIRIEQLRTSNAKQIASNEEFVASNTQQISGNSVRVAGILLCILGLDHTFLLSHRLALMDTPASAIVCAAYLCFVLGISWKASAGGYGFLCGTLLVLAYTVRGLAALIFLCPILALLPQYRVQKSLIFGILGGVSLGMLLYIVLWYLPNREELSRYNSYYLHSQLLPHSIAQLAGNIATNLFSWSRGLFPYLIKHTGVVFALAMWQVLLYFRHKSWRDDPMTGFLVWWFVLYLGLYSAVNYAPSRYYVLFYPALAILAARGMLALWEDGLSNRRELKTPGKKADVLRTNRLSPNTAYGKFFAFIHLITEVQPFKWIVRRTSAFLPGTFLYPVFALCGLGILLNGYWLTDWATHLTYRQIEANRTMARMLPEKAWVIGSVAPGLCIETRLRPVNVIPGLCNDNYPVESRAGELRVIAILDGKWRQDYWEKKYGAQLTEKQKRYTFYGLLRPFFEIGVYDASPEFAK